MAPLHFVRRSRWASQVTGPSSSYAPESNTTSDVPLPRPILSVGALEPSGQTGHWAPESHKFRGRIPWLTRSPDYASTSRLPLRLQVWLPAGWASALSGQVSHLRDDKPSLRSANAWRYSSRTSRCLVASIWLIICRGTFSRSQNSRSDRDVELDCSTRAAHWAALLRGRRGFIVLMDPGSIPGRARRWTCCR